MKILHINYTVKGGAAISAIRLHEELLKIGVDSNLLTLEHSQKKIKKHYIYDGIIKSNKPTYPILTFKNLILEKFLKNYEKKQKKYLSEINYKKKIKKPSKIGLYNYNSFTLFSFPESSYDITSLDIFKQADLIHLHWISEFVDFPSFFSQVNKPIVWTLHDANPFMGGFHHFDDLNKNIHTHRQIEEEILKTKLKYIDFVIDLKIVSPSKWLFEDAKSSEMFKNRDIKLIRNGVDKNRFRLKNKTYCREILNLPQDKKIFLIVSSDLNDYRKGLDLVYEASNKVLSDVLFLFCGSNFIYNENKKIVYFGEVYDEELLSILYSAVDFTIIPSRLDNLPNILLESMMCGTPVISFDVSDFRSIFIDNNYGVLVNETSSELLAIQIDEIINKNIFFDVIKIRNYAISLFDINKISLEYLNVYKSLFDK
jgi:glycosyltransferase involved in cell wall biosynthesis